MIRRHSAVVLLVVVALAETSHAAGSARDPLPSLDHVLRSLVAGNGHEPLPIVVVDRGDGPERMILDDLFAPLSAGALTVGASLAGGPGATADAAVATNPAGRGVGSGCGSSVFVLAFSRTPGLRPLELANAPLRPLAEPPRCGGAPFGYSDSWLGEQRARVADGVEVTAFACAGTAAGLSRWILSSASCHRDDFREAALAGRVSTGRWEICFWHWSDCYHMDWVLAGHGLGVDQPASIAIR